MRARHLRSGAGRLKMLRFLPRTEWTQKEAAARREEAARLARALGVSPRTARLLLTRGVADAAEAEAFLHPSADMLCDPFAFPDMEKAVARLTRAIEKRERICVYGDYDVDGVCATSMLLMYLRACGAAVSYHIPSRHAEGYGMNLAAVERLAAEGVGLIITVDNGVKANAELLRCRELGMDAIVTDHHLPGDTLPECEAILCHTLPGCAYLNHNICGAGTAFKLIEALGGRAAALPYVALAGLATVADVVPLTGENRVFVSLALAAVNGGECPLGLRALVEAAFEKKRVLSARDFAFAIAPRLNAAGRMEDASLGVALLTEADAGRARALAQRLNELNAARQREEGAIYEAACAAIEADDLTEKRGIVLKSADWNPGVVGIAASKLTERYYRPVVLLCERDGVLTGSARSIEGVDLHAALKENERFFTRFGGHAYAAGMTLPAENFEAFATAFDESVRAIAPEEAFLPAAHYEAEAAFSELTMQLAAELSMLAPFGEGNPVPVFRTDGAAVKRLRRIGEEGKHLRLTLEQENQYAEGVWFYGGSRFAQINDYGRCGLLYVPTVNEYNGRQSLQLELKAMRPTAPADAEQYLAAQQGKFLDAICANIRYNKMHAAAAYSAVDADDFLLEQVSHGIAGLLVLCFTPAGARRFLRLAEASGLYGRMEIGFGRNAVQPAAYHAAVLAPELDALTIQRFRTVLVYDTPVTLGLLDALAALASGARLALAEPVPGDADELLAALRFDREAFIPFYQALRKGNGSFYNREALLDHFVRETHAPRYLCALAADMALELGFLCPGEGDLLRFAPPEGRRELMQSATFSTLASLAEMYEHATSAARRGEADAPAHHHEEEQP